MTVGQRIAMMLHAKNKFLEMKKGKKSEALLLENLKQYYIKAEEEELSALRMLCGSEKEPLFLEIKDTAPIDIDFFMSHKIGMYYKIKVGVYESKKFLHSI